MIWVYYAALILLFGAEITQAVAAQRGAAIVPSEHAKASAGLSADRRASVDARLHELDEPLDLEVEGT